MDTCFSYLTEKLTSLEVKFGSFQVRHNSKSENPSLNERFYFVFKENLLFPFFERWGLGLLRLQI